MTHRVEKKNPEEEQEQPKKPQRGWIQIVSFGTHTSSVGINKDFRVPVQRHDLELRRLSLPHGSHPAKSPAMAGRRFPTLPPSDFWPAWLPLVLSLLLGRRGLGRGGRLG